MGLQAITSSTNPLQLSDIKTQLRVTNDLTDSGGTPYSSDDAALTVFLAAAFEYIERETRQQLCTRQYLYTLDGFPGESHHGLSDYTIRAIEPFSFDRVHLDRVIKLPKPPLQSVQSIQYVDQTGATQTLDPSTYTVDTTTRPGRVVLNPGFDWPQTSCRANAVQITFTAGYGDPTTVPVVLNQAILLLAGSWYETREDSITLRINSIPIGVTAIVNQNMFPEAVG